ncbi:MAG: sensor histidine kinase, partial [Candidatus Nanopelagicales bacterium]
RREHPMPIWAVVIADGILGLVFTLVTGFGASILDLPTSSNLLERCLLNMMYAMWWGPTLSYFMDLREQWASEREQLVTEFVQVELTAIQQGELMSLLQEELDEEIADELSPARDRITALRLESDAQGQAVGKTAAEWHEAAQLLRGTAENSIRPLSRQLLKETAKNYSGTHWWTLLANVVRKQPFQPLAFAIIDILGTFSPLIRTYGVTRGLVLLFGGLAWTVLLMLMANALMRRFSGQHSLIFITALIVLQSTVLLRGHFRELWEPGSAEPSWFITQVIAGIAVVFVTSGIGAWWSQRVEIRATLREEIRADRVQAMAMSQQVALLARETSQVLHGSVQTRLVSCAMAIEQASASGDADLLNAALNEAIVVLERPVVESSDTRSLADEVSRKTELWEGLCSFTVVLDPAARSVGSTAAVTIGRIVEEGISNAIRHGKATSIDISVTRVNELTVRVEVLDNGHGPQGGKASVGSAFVQQASSGRWSLTASESGSQLEAFVGA